MTTCDSLQVSPLPCLQLLSWKWAAWLLSSLLYLLMWLTLLCVTSHPLLPVSSYHLGKSERTRFSSLVLWGKALWRGCWDLAGTPLLLNSISSVRGFSSNEVSFFCLVLIYSSKEYIYLWILWFLYQCLSTSLLDSLCYVTSMCYIWWCIFKDK